MDRPDVFDALIRIKEGLDTPQNESAVVVARHDLLRLTQYIGMLESVMDEIQNASVPPYGKVTEKPWQMFNQRLEWRNNANI